MKKTKAGDLKWPSLNFKEKSLFIRDEEPCGCVRHRVLLTLSMPHDYIVIVQDTLDFSTSSIHLVEGPALGQDGSDQDYLRPLWGVGAFSQGINDWDITTFEWITNCLSLILPASFLVRFILTLCYTIGKKRKVWKRIDSFKLQCNVWGLEVNKSMRPYKYYNLWWWYVSSIVKMNKWS